jgi:hypothetical protein
VEVNGGAVELSWTIQNVRGEGRRCQDGALGAVQLHAALVEGGLEYASEAWDCDRYHGVTKFEIPEGRWRMDLAVLCGDGAAAQVGVPDPIVRDVREGEVVQLNALLIVLQGQCPTI